MVFSLGMSEPRRSYLSGLTVAMFVCHDLSRAIDIPTRSLMRTLWDRVVFEASSRAAIVVFSAFQVPQFC